MLPTWVKGGKPVIKNRSITAPRILVLVFIIIGIFYLTHGSPTFYSSSSPKSNSSSFIVAPELFPPPPPLKRPAHLPEPIAPKQDGMVVPNAVHYVYGLKPVADGEKAEELPYYAYLAIRSAIINLRPDKIYFHYKHLPTGPWWDMIARHLTLIETEVPDSVLGRSLSHFAHKADVLRLQAMKHSGGIYLDIDIFVVKPFDDLLYNPTTLGMEASPDSRRTELDPEGLCNAIIIAAPNAPFIDRWLASYESFDEYNWAGHSVVKPWELARAHPEELQVLNSRAFFWPMWHGEEIQYTHERDDYDFRKTGQYAYHAWESLAMKYLSKLSPKSIRSEDTSFHRLVRPFIGPDDDEVYREWERRRRGKL